jgi:hypothetical protein
MEYAFHTLNLGVVGVERQGKAMVCRILSLDFGAKTVCWELFVIVVFLNNLANRQNCLRFERRIEHKERKNMD